jgi:glycosyltransferase involved in cell wall biosynthesis
VHNGTAHTREKRSPLMPRPHPGIRRGVRVLALAETFDDGTPMPCSYIRIIRPLELAAAQGLLSYALVSAKAIERYTADVFLTHRAAIGSLDAAEQLVTHCRRHGMALVYDLDDNLFEPAPDHPELGAIAKVKPTCLHLAASASEVWVSTAHLAGYVSRRNGRTWVAANAYDGELWGEPRASSAPAAQCRILYAGTVTHAADFELVRPALAQLVKKYNERVRVSLLGISTRSYEEPWIERVSLDTPAAHIYPVFADCAKRTLEYDIGLAPLADNEFNRSKSAIKLLEYAALGLACVASDVGAYRDFIQHGVSGLLVRNTTEDWVRALDRVIADGSFRQLLQAGARARVAVLPNAAASARLRAERLRSLVSAGIEGVAEQACSSGHAHELQKP